MSNLGLPLGEDKVLMVDSEKISIGKSRILAKALTEVKKKHSPFTKYPLKDGETIEEWQNRVVPLLRGPKHDLKRKVDEDGNKEDNEAYLSRVLEVEIENTDLYYDMLKMIDDNLADGKSITPESFEGVSLEAAIFFMRDIMSRARIDLDEVFPKRFEPIKAY